jgi:hypothetical protein
MLANHDHQGTGGGGGVLVLAIHQSCDGGVVGGQLDSQNGYFSAQAGIHTSWLTIHAGQGFQQCM